MFEFIKSAFKLVAATDLAPVVVPKVKPSQQSRSPFLTRTASRSALPINERRLANTDITTFRTNGTTRAVIRAFAAASPDLSNAVATAVRTAITANYTAVAKDMDGKFNREATALLQQLLTRFNVVKNYDEGFSNVNSIRECSEAMGKEIMLYGALACELVLDKSRLPYKIVPVSVTTVQLFQDKDGMKAKQAQAQGDPVDLDIPTFFYSALDQDLQEPYAASPLEPAIAPAIFLQEFMNDVRRIVKRTIHPRLHVTISEEKFRKNLPLEAQHDEEKMRAAMATMLSDIEDKVNNLAPEDALVFFDTLGFDYADHGNTGLASEYETIRSLAEGKLATGAKTMGTILGHQAASANIASAETLLYIKHAEGSIQFKLNEIYSRALTLAIRLFGFDCYVEFAYDRIDLRPDIEIEAFRSMKQSRVLELLSLGMITDEEACIKLTGSLPPEGMTPLTGTMFMSKKPDPSEENPDGSTNNGSTMNQNLKSDAPKGTRGSNTEKNPVKQKAEDESDEMLQATDEAPVFVAPNITVNLEVDANQKRTSTMRLRREEDGSLTVEREDV